MMEKDERRRTARRGDFGEEVVLRGRQRASLDRPLTGCELPGHQVEGGKGGERPLRRVEQAEAHVVVLDKSTLGTATEGGGEVVR